MQGARDAPSKVSQLLVSTTLTGSNEGQIADALLSVVGWVDWCLVIDTGARDRTLAIARDICGDKYRERTFPWIHDFAAARNFALDAATELGASWAITLDTDERIDLAGEDLRELLRTTKHGVVMMPDNGRTYCKERCFRLPCPVRFEGPTHESFAGYRVGACVARAATFVELPKSSAALRAKFLRDKEILIRHIDRVPGDPRWHYYLGETLRNLGELEPAIVAYDRCASLRGWDEESAWACYRAGECLMGLNRYQEALERCALGLARHAGIAELAWLAGFAAFRLGQHAQCAYWARLATVFGLFAGQGRGVPRIGFRHPPALWEGPYDLLRFALRALGDGPGADEAERRYQEALRARLSLAPERAERAGPGLSA